jgi:AAA+ ATPase superfamily predicted ATPase
MSILRPNQHLIARLSEVQVFQQLEASHKSEFIAIYGRRRIGKTYLVHEYFKTKTFFFEFNGTKDTPTKIQIKNFVNELQHVFKVVIPITPTNWSEAFNLLTDIIRDTKISDQKKVIFFDELPWLASRKSGFLEALDYFWNSFLSKSKDSILIVCGSSANWMISQVINNRGGLHNRITRAPLAMSPFTLLETKQYLQTKKIDLTAEQIIELYMVTGGVAYYLDQYRKGESAAQFINRSFFAKDGDLYNEFDRLFRSLFEHYEIHIDIVKILAKSTHGLSQGEIVDKLKISSGGTLTKTLTELEKSGFIHFTPQIGRKKKEGTYRLIDEYTLFYLTWIENLGRTFQDPNYWQKQIGKPRYNTWLGQAFEALCFKHIEVLKTVLGISALTTFTYGFRNKIAQIDLVIERSDRTINLCEMKYTKSPFEMTESEASRIKIRKQELLKKLKTKVQVFTTLVTLFPAKKNKHYLNVIDNELDFEGLV